MLTAFFQEKVRVFFREKYEKWYLATLSIWRRERNVGSKEKKKNRKWREKRNIEYVKKEYEYGTKIEERLRVNRDKREENEPRYDSKRKTEEEWKIEPKPGPVINSGVHQ